LVTRNKPIRMSRKNTDFVDGPQEFYVL